MRRDPATGAPDFFSYARDYLHVYMPRVRAMSPKTIEAYRISLECFLGYLDQTGHVHREHVSFARASQTLFSHDRRLRAMGEKV